VALLALTTAIAGLSVAGCSSDITSDKGGKDGVSDGKQGSVGLNLQPVSGVTINVVNYTVTQGNAPGAAVVKTGNLPVPGTGKDFSFGVPLPKGTGYYLNLTADSVDGKVTCAGGFGPFDIAANTSVDITPTLTCTDITTGQPIVLVDVVTTACPDISFDYVVATPKSADVGSSISLLSNAVSGSGKTLTYQWTIGTAATGTITPPTAKDASLACNAQKSGELITITASNGECSKSITTKVSCVDVKCGNGVVDPGETCDKALSPTCPADCTQVCGDGSVEGTETCEPPNTAACSATCGPRDQVCGDGFITGTEACDGTVFPTGTATGSTCSSDCLTITPPVVAAMCNNSVVEAGELCDPPFSANNCGGLTAGSPAGATAACTAIESAACTTCVEGAGLGAFDCSTLTGNAAAGPASGQPLKALCYKLLDCMYDTNCAAADPVDCYCGNSGAACQTGGANGKCRAEIEASLETTAFADVGARIGDPSFAGGVAVVRVDSARSACGSTCGTL
jgi:hypothetical protein